MVKTYVGSWFGHDAFLKRDTFTLDEIFSWSTEKSCDMTGHILSDKLRWWGKSKMQFWKDVV